MKRTRRFRQGLGAWVAVLLLSGCDDWSDLDEGGGGAKVIGEATTSGIWSLSASDSQIAQMLLLSNGGAVQAGQAAVNRVTREDIRSYANRLVNEYTQVNTTLSNWIASTGIFPAPSTHAATISQDNQLSTAAVEVWSGSVVDQVYLRSQSSAQARLLFYIDTVMLPNAQDPTLRSELVNLRTAVSSQLQDGINLQNAVVPQQ